MHELSDFWPFFTAFAWLMAAGLGGPFPEEIPTIGAGIWVAANPELGPLRWLILPVCLLGVLLSDIMLYGIGRLSGYRLLERPWVKRLISKEKWDQIQENFHRYGVKVLLLIRWVPAIRSPMFISAGIMRLPLGRFVVADGIAAVFGHSLLFGLAYWFGDQFQDLVMHAEQKVDRLKPLLVLLLIAVLVGFLLNHFMRRPISTGDPEELPIIGDKVAAKIEAPNDPEPKPVTDEAKDGLAPHQKSEVSNGQPSVNEPLP